MATTRSYTVSTAFSNGVNTSCFHVECEEATLSVNFINITVVSDTLTLHFDGDLSAGDETTIDAAVAAHDPVNCALDAFLVFAGTKVIPFRDLTYDVDGLLSDIKFYDDVGRTEHIFTQTFSYTGGLLDQTTLTRISDSMVFTKQLIYNPDNTLKSVEFA